MNRIVKRIFCFVAIVVCSSFSSACVAQEAASISVNFTDSSGNSVSNVKAYWYREGKAKKIFATDGKGTVPTNKGLIVAKADGFQFSGIILGKKASPITVMMLEENEAGPEFKTRPLPFSNEQQQQIVSEIEETFWNQVKSNREDHAVLQNGVPILVKLAPDKTIEYFEANPLNGEFDPMVKQAMITELASSRFETAVELADSIEGPMYRSSLLYFLISFADAEANAVPLLAVETEFVNAIKKIPQPAYRFAVWASLARHYFESGRPELAKKIVEQHLAEVEKLPAGGWSGYPRSLFASLICESDPEKAEELIKGMDQTESDRAHGRIAFFCCRKHPEKAIELLKTITPVKNAITGYENHVKVCHRMAIEQTDRAFELAQLIEDPNQRAWALGMMAMRLHDSKPSRAREALSLAVSTLDMTETKNTSLAPSSTLAGLLPVAKKISPDRMSSMIWKSVYLAIPRSRWNMGNESKQSKIQATAVAISRYDSEIGTALVGQRRTEIGMSVEKSVASQIVFDIDKLSEFFAQLDKDENRAGLEPRKSAAEMLTGSEKEFWNAVSKPAFLEWPSSRFEEL